MKRIRTGVLAMACMVASFPAFSADRYVLDIPRQPLGPALRKFAEQSGLQLVYYADVATRGRMAGVSGTLSVDEALGAMLVGSGLKYAMVDEHTVAIAQDTAQEDAMPAGATGKDGHDGGPSALSGHAAGPIVQSSVEDAGNASAKPPVVGMPAIMVEGLRTLNMDISRSRDDPQPYVVFDREQIERSGASSLPQLLEQRLTMNSRPVAYRNESTSGGGGVSLRGLGAAQTLILIDGRRMTGPSVSGNTGQADISGIPLAAIERIEVLPTTASGIYGGGATGGVINIIMRRDYTGAEIKATYDNTFDTDTAGRKFDLTFGHGFNDGATSVLASASVADSNVLLARDRHFPQRGRNAIWINHPSYFLPPSGLPPLSSRPNIASADGADLVLDDGTPLGAAFTSVPQGYQGVQSDNGRALLQRAGQYDWDLSNTAAASRVSGGRQELYTQPASRSGSLSIQHRHDDSLQLFADLSASRVTKKFQTGLDVSYLLPADSPFNPFLQDIQVAVPIAGLDSYKTTRIRNDRALVGAVKRLGDAWQLGFDYAWSRSRVTYENALGAPTLADAIHAGELDVLRDTTLYPIDGSPYALLEEYTSPFTSTMKDANLRLSGPLMRIPGGDITLSTALGRREESIADSWWVLPVYEGVDYYPSRSQRVNSAYVELRVPFFGEANARRGLKALDLQLALRRDDYLSTSGEVQILDGIPDPLVPPESSPPRNRSGFVSVDPTIALRWTPVQDVAVRVSYGTGFLPPALNQISSSSFFGVVGAYTDPLRGNTPLGPIAYRFGGNPALRPEQSESWSAGLIVTPSALPGLRVSLDYTRIEKTDNIALYPGSNQGIIDNAADFPGRVVRGPNLEGDPAGWAGPIVSLDGSVMNLATAFLEAWDVQIDYRKDTASLGVFDVFFMGTWQPHYIVRTTQDTPEVEYVGTSAFSPIQFKASAGVSWSKAAWRAGWNVSHLHAYQASTIPQVIVSQGNGGKVASQTYHDVFASYDFGLSGRTLPGWMSGTEVQVGLRNVFDKAPPMDVGNSNGGMFSELGDPRMASYYMSVRVRF